MRYSTRVCGWSTIDNLGSGATNEMDPATTVWTGAELCWHMLFSSFWMDVHDQNQAPAWLRMATVPTVAFSELLNHNYSESFFKKRMDNLNLQESEVSVKQPQNSQTEIW